MGKKSPTRIPSLNTLESVKEALDVRLGRRGDPLDRALTVRDLTESGLPVKAVRRTNLTDFTVEYEEKPSKWVPAVPVGFVAYPSFGGINLAWGLPREDFMIAHTEVYRSLSSDPTTRVLVSTAGGMMYFDVLDDQDQTPYFYWIRHVSVSGHVGPFAGPLEAESLPLVSDIIERITGEIDAGVLAQSLQDEISLISGPDSLVGSINFHVRNLELAAQAEAEARAEALRAESEARQAAISKEHTEWVSAAEALAEQVETLFSAADALGARINSEERVRSDQYSALAEQQQTLTAASEKAFADIGIERKARIDDVSALTSTLEAQVSQLEQDYQAAILAERTTQADTNESLARQIGSVRAVSEANVADIERVDQTISSNVSALSTAVQSLTARLDATPVWVSNFEAGSDIERWTPQGGAGLSAYAADDFGGSQSALVTYTGLPPASSGVTGGVYARLTESVTQNFSEKRIRVTGYAKRHPDNGLAASEFAVAYSCGTDGDSGWHRFQVQPDWTLFEFLWDVPSATPGRADYLSIWGDTLCLGRGVLIDLVNIQPATTEEDLPAITAAINEEAAARIDADKASAERLTAAKAELGDAIAQAEDVRRSEVKRLDDRVNSTSSALTAAQSSIGGAIAAVETKLGTEVEKIDGELATLNSYWYTKVQSNGLIGGFALGNNGQSVEAGFDVDRFWVGRTNGDKRKPFIIENGYVYMNKVMIAEGSIQEGQLGAITIGKLKDSSGSPITTVGGLIRADAIDVNNLTVQEAARFTGDVFSNNYVPGKSGWAMLQSGYVEFNEAMVRGNLEVQSVTVNGESPFGAIRISDSSTDLREVDSLDRVHYRTLRGSYNLKKMAKGSKINITAYPRFSGSIEGQYGSGSYWSSDETDHWRSTLGSVKVRVDIRTRVWIDGVLVISRTETPLDLYRSGRPSEKRPRLVYQAAVNPARYSSGYSFEHIYPGYKSLSTVKVEVRMTATFDRSGPGSVAWGIVGDGANLLVGDIYRLG